MPDEQVEEGGGGGNEEAAGAAAGEAAGAGSPEAQPKVSESGDEDSAGGQEGGEAGQPAAAPTISYRLLIAAGAAGVSEEDALAFGSDAALGRHIALVDRMREDFAAQRDGNGQRREVPATEQQRAEQGKQQEAVKWPEISADSYGAEMVEFGKAARGQIEALQARLSEIEQTRVGGLESRLNAMIERDYEARFDKAVDGLGDDWKDVFGAAENMTPEQEKNRQRLHTTAMVYGKQSRRNGQDLAQAVFSSLKESAGITFPDKFKTISNARKGAAADARSKVRQPGNPQGGEPITDKETALGKIRAGLSRMREAIGGGS